MTHGKGALAFKPKQTTRDRWRRAAVLLLLTALYASRADAKFNESAPPPGSTPKEERIGRREAAAALQKIEAAIGAIEKEYARREPSLNPHTNTILLEVAAIRKTMLRLALLVDKKRREVKKQ